MSTRKVAIENVMSDLRPRCILCERLIPEPRPIPAIPREPDAICVQCIALPLDQRRLLGDQAMTRLTERKHTV